MFYDKSKLIKDRKEGKKKKLQLVILRFFNAVWPKESQVQCKKLDFHCFLKERCRKRKDRDIKCGRRNCREMTSFRLTFQLVLRFAKQVDDDHL